MHVSTLSWPPPNDDITTILLRKIVSHLLPAEITDFKGRLRVSFLPVDYVALYRPVALLSYQNAIPTHGFAQKSADGEGRQVDLWLQSYKRVVNVLILKCPGTPTCRLLLRLRLE